MTLLMTFLYRLAINLSHTLIVTHVQASNPVCHTGVRLIPSSAEPSEPHDRRKLRLGDLGSGTLEVLAHRKRRKGRRSSGSRTVMRPESSLSANPAARMRPTMLAKS